MPNKSTLPYYESSSLSSLVKTYRSDCSDPVEFARKKGYEVVNIIASGSFGKVYRVQTKVPRRDSSGSSSDDSQTKTVNLAMKVFYLDDDNNRMWVERCLKNEMYIAKYVKHQNVVLTLEVLKTTHHGYIFMQLGENGSIKSELFKQLKRPYTDGEAKERFSGLLRGLHYLHSQNIVHRDLKLDNFLLTEKNVPMIGDFGFSARAKIKDIVLTQLHKKTICGTKGYMAPEMFPGVKADFLNGGSSHHHRSRGQDQQQGQPSSDWAGYDGKKLDVYAMGVCLFEMLQLRKPFEDETTKETMAMIAAHQVHYHHGGADVEEAAKELIASMTAFKPEDRPSAEEALKHRWITGHGHFVSALISRFS